MAWPVVLRKFVRCAAVTIFSFVYSSSAAPTDEMTSTLFVGGARIEVVTGRGSERLPVEDLLRWLKSAADSVRVYYGRFPIHRCPFISRHSVEGASATVGPSDLTKGEESA
jgi:hypothetical protein